MDHVLICFAGCNYAIYKMKNFMVHIVGLCLNLHQSG